jgi:hypothetical protein
VSSASKYALKHRKKKLDEGWERFEVLLPPAAAKRLLERAGNQPRKRAQTLVDLILAD